MPSEEPAPVGGVRQWVYATDHNKDEAASGVASPDNGPAADSGAVGWHFTAMTYNVLSDALLHRYAETDYPDVPLEMLKWDNRLPGLLMEIQRQSPDVLALQEVDRMSDFLRPLSKLGYGGRFVANTGRRIDGSAIFWKLQKFELAQHQDLQFRDHGLRHNEALLVKLRPLQGSVQQDASGQAAGHGPVTAVPQGASEAMPRAEHADGDAAMPVAEHADGDAAAAAVSSLAIGAGRDNRHHSVGVLPLLTVSTIHMAHDPTLDELVKPAQARVLLAATQRLAAGGPAVIMGDFNSQPGSVVHSHYAGGTSDCTPTAVGMSSASADAAMAEDPMESPKAASAAVAAADSAAAKPADKARLMSAYEAVCGQEAGFTAVGIHRGQAYCTVDYIWYTPQADGCSLQPQAVLQAPDLAVLQHGVPSRVLPSDHVPLVAKFRMQLATAAG